MAAPSTLQEAWLGAADGRLCPREQARAWALREVWQEEGKASCGLLAFVASKAWEEEVGAPLEQPSTTDTMRGWGVERSRRKCDLSCVPVGPCFGLSRPQIVPWLGQTSKRCIATWHARPTHP